MKIAFQLETLGRQPLIENSIYWHGYVIRLILYLLSGSVSEKFPGQMGSFEFFRALPDKNFCLGLSSHLLASGKFV